MTCYKTHHDTMVELEPMTFWPGYIFFFTTLLSLGDINI